MKNLYVHFGMHKTASTSIQVALCRLEDRLRSTGILYPQSARPSNARFGHHLIPWAFICRKNFVPEVKGVTETINNDTILNSLIQEIEESDCQNIIISSEEFDVLDSMELEEFFSYFRGYKIIPIIYLRNTVDFLESGYKTSVFYSGYKDTFDVYCSNQRSRLDTFNFVRHLFYLSDGRVIVKNYDVLKREDRLISDFMELFGVDIGKFGFQSDLVENISLPTEVVEIVRFLNNKQVGFPVVQKCLDQLSNAPSELRIHLFSESEVQRKDKAYLEDLGMIAKLLEGNKYSFQVNADFSNRDNDSYQEVNLAKSLLYIILF